MSIDQHDTDLAGAELPRVDEAVATTNDRTGVVAVEAGRAAVYAPELTEPEAPEELIIPSATRAPRHRGLIAGGATVALVIAGGVGWLVTRGGDSDPSAAAAPRATATAGPTPKADTAPSTANTSSTAESADLRPVAIATTGFSMNGSLNLGNPDNIRNVSAQSFVWSGYAENYSDLVTPGEQSANGNISTAEDVVRGALTDLSAVFTLNPNDPSQAADYAAAEQKLLGTTDPSDQTVQTVEAWRSQLEVFAGQLGYAPGSYQVVAFNRAPLSFIATKDADNNPTLVVAGDRTICFAIIGNDKTNIYQDPTDATAANTVGAAYLTIAFGKNSNALVVSGLSGKLQEMAGE